MLKGEKPSSTRVTPASPSPFRLLARTGQVIEQDTAFVAVHVFSFGSERTRSR